MDLTVLLKSQHQELEETINKVLIHRTAENFFGDLLKSGLAKIVSGIRRCGKSVFIYLILKNKSFGYVNFDDERILGFTGDDIMAGLSEVYGNDCKILFFDEIQNFPDWELFINRLQRRGFNLFITGSNAKLLSKELATHLTGRHIKIELFPFSFKEYLDAIKFKEDIQTIKGQHILKQKLKNYITGGGFPEIVVKKENPRTYLIELYKDIITRDIISRHNISYKKTFRELAQTLISNPSKGISYRKLSRHFKIKSEHTIKNYISYLEEAYIIFLINRFSFKPVEVEKSEKKVYAIDTGLINYVSLKTNEDKGQIYENIVALELLRKKTFNQLIEIYYWKNNLHEEVDFVVKSGLKVKQLIQVCYEINVFNKEREIRALIKSSKELKCNNLLIITQDYESEEKIKNKKIKYTPLWKWLLK